MNPNTPQLLQTVKAVQLSNRYSLIRRETEAQTIQKALATPFQSVMLGQAR